MTEERIRLGWKIDEREYPFLVDASALSEREMKDRLSGADVIIYGDTGVDIYGCGLKKDVLVLYYRERMFKKQSRVGILRFIKYYCRYVLRGFGRNKALLCASAYASYDFERIAAFGGRRFKWGYFPEIFDEDVDALLAKKREGEAMRLLWVGRIIDWKRTKDAVSLAARLRDEGLDFSLDIIGTGELEGDIAEKISEYGLAGKVNMLGSLPQAEVREYMRRASVLLVTSDHNEGWGAVVNEGMNSACAVVSSHGVGAAPFMIQSGKNGVIYECANIDSMYAAVKECILDREYTESLGRAAYLTVKEVWNAENAAVQLLRLVDVLRQGKGDFASEGVCSPAEVIKNDWIK